MNTADELLELARALSRKEGARTTAGRLFNIGAVLLAETGVEDRDLEMQLRLAFLRFDVDKIYGAHGAH